jgi:hypothetical protein
VWCKRFLPFLLLPKTSSHYVRLRREALIVEGFVQQACCFYLGRPMFKSRPRHWLTWLRICVVFLSPSKQMPGHYLKLGYMTPSFHILSNSSFTCCPFIWHYIAWVPEKALLNKQQINKQACCSWNNYTTQFDHTESGQCWSCLGFNVADQKAQLILKWNS